MSDRMCGRKMIEIEINLNGSVARSQIDDNTLLVHFLRETLGLKGTHVGCDTSQCGCCIVLVNDLAVKSCTMLAAEADGAHVRTIEGAKSETGALSKVQQAFVDCYALQCGFCTPGMIMSATALLQEIPKPTVEEIRSHLAGNLCRCTGYQNIVKAIFVASGQSWSESDHTST